ncbi:carboxymuconolactone decarboxylase family protein [Aureimonas glaciei]|uniref:Carboxymuconolactone decarboxylase family protein n=1 Tax=Aureimonas glaciei TaxID=1776957 RepID=A0A916V2G7_9HYPH|nr:carboxymuconolactone decarboxylase family protein [Aureimonas glaciei]GGD01787.1 hypothetical protein GCM10011335_00440 [Aureimonas glaciei]
MRLPLVDPADLTEAQKPLYADMKAGIAEKFTGFKAVDREERLLGPWNPWLHEPKTGSAIWALTRALTENSCLPDNIRQIAILVVGVDFDAAYEIYAHIAVAERDGFSPARLQTMLAGDKPDDLTPEEEIAHDVTFALIGGGALPDDMYAAAVGAFGPQGTHELITLVGLYCMVSVTLNGFDVPVPDEDA